MKNFHEIIRLLGDSKFFYTAITGMDGVYKYVNTNYANAIGYIDKQMIGKRYDINMDEDELKMCKEISAKCFQYPNRPFPVTLRKRNGEGRSVITQWELQAVLDGNNKPTGVFCLGYDITEYAVVNQQLEVAKSEIEYKKNVLDQIYWEQSHLIRRPVANIIGLANILIKMEPDHNLKNICFMLTECANQLDEAVKSIVKLTE